MASSSRSTFSPACCAASSSASRAPASPTCGPSSPISRARRFRANNFDRALLVTVLGEIPDRDAALRAIFDALKPGGILSITEILRDPHYQRRTTVLRLAAGGRL